MLASRQGDNRMGRLSDWLYQIAKWQTICIATLVYGMFLSQVMVPHAAEMKTSAGEWGAPDGHIFYSPDKLYAEIEHWGNTGRRHYAQFRLGLDPLWALTYTAFLISITSVALRRAFPGDSPRRLLNLVALVPICADLLENGFGIFLVQSYPERFDGMAWLMAITSCFKWLTLTIAHLIMLYAIFTALHAILAEKADRPDR